MSISIDTCCVPVPLAKVTNFTKRKRFSRNYLTTDSENATLYIERALLRRHFVPSAAVPRTNAEGAPPCYFEILRRKPNFGLEHENEL